MRTWLTHLRSLRPTSIFLGLMALLIAAVFVFAMVKAGDYSSVPMVAALAASILALAIFLPPRISNYSLGLYLFLLGINAVAKGELLGISRETQPIRYWLWTLFLFLSAAVLFHAAYRARNTPMPPNPTIAKEPREGDARPRRKGRSP